MRAVVGLAVLATAAVVQVAAQPPLGYTCDASWWGDGLCDCGCGVYEPECANGVEQANTCNGLDATGLPAQTCNALTNTCTLSDPSGPGAGWYCSNSDYGDGICDCFCGAEDIDCAVDECLNCADGKCFTDAVEGLVTGVVVGLAVGGALLLGTIILCIYCICIREQTPGPNAWQPQPNNTASSMNPGVVYVNTGAPNAYGQTTIATGNLAPQFQMQQPRVQVAQQEPIVVVPVAQYVNDSGK